MEKAISYSLERVVRHGVGFFCIGVWAVVGFIYWVPLLARSCGAYSGAVIFTIVGGKPANKKAVRMLDAASNFYFRGFRDIRESVFGDASSAESEDTSEQLSIFGSWDEFLRVLRVVFVETAIAVLFWLLLFLLVEHIFG